MPHLLKDIRASYLDFFARNDHKVMNSASLVPEHDPTLLFSNAGMVPFKDIFTGKRKAPQPPRAVSSQKCVRAGGKHNDLDNVGYTARHHTFFEMLGNFSFGDYFKEQAIVYAWEFLTKDLNIAPDRLLVTFYHEDSEALALWQKISGLGSTQIIKIATQDNFWSMGDVGPCGPCSEIFYDHGAQIAGGPPGSPEEYGDRFVEIWNLVFMQFEQKAAGERILLPQPSIDTGMGLERVAALMQGAHNNYETDLFQNLIGAAEGLLHKKASGANLNSFRVLADHLRSVSFLIADGVQPSNEGRGYVLRRILRRAMRHIHLLGVEEPVFFRLIPALETEMGTDYPELSQASATITETVKQEEERFAEMLTRGMGLLEKEMAGLQQGALFSGEVAFKLYDTFGFPLDLTQDALRRSGHQVNVAAFDKALAAQRTSSRTAWKGSGDVASDDIFLTLSDEQPTTDFTGYEENESEGDVLALIQKGALTNKLEAGASAMVLLNRTPFYAESGGQVGDRGILSQGENTFVVEDTQKQGGSLHIHYGTLTQGTLAVGDKVLAKIDDARRTPIRANHSATHLLHEALRQVLGKHVSQKGSLVDEHHLRFDFSHGKPLSLAETRAIEDRVNAQIRINQAVETHEMEQAEARQSGAIAMFGEKYDKRVRVLFMGEKLPDDSARSNFSIEFCGGCHVRSTGDIALFKITSQTAVGSGVRRIIALTGQAAFEHLRQQQERLSAAAQMLKTLAENLPERLAALVEENKRLDQSLKAAKRNLALQPAQQSKKPHIEKVGSASFMSSMIENISAKEMRILLDDAKKQIGSGVVALGSLNLDKGNGTLMVGVTKDLVARYDSVVLVKMGAALLGGSGGGGRAEMAQAGGPNGDRLKDAIQVVRDNLKEVGEKV